MNIKYLLICASVPFLLCSCAMNFYLETEKVDDPSSKVKIVRNENKYMLMGLISLSNACSDARGFGVVLMDGGGTLPKGKDEFIERMIPAGKPTTIALRGWSTPNKQDWVCSIALTFTPERRAEYELNYSYPGKTCHVSVRKSNYTAMGEKTWSAVEDVKQVASSCYYYPTLGNP